MYTQPDVLCQSKKRYFPGWVPPYKDCKSFNEKSSFAYFSFKLIFLMINLIGLDILAVNETYIIATTLIAI